MRKHITRLGPRRACLIGVCAVLIAACSNTPPAPPAPLGDVESAQVPDPFWDFDPNSNFAISYGDVDAVLKALVEDRGRSSREKLPPMKAATGTRLKTKVKRETANEANRFYFESFEDNEEYKEVLTTLRRNLEQIPDQMPLEQFSRAEQLAYWLNLYNVTVLERLVQIYPERNLKKEITGRNSFFSDKILTVSGVPLSLDDIQHTILRWNYDDNPLVIYGLYQGNIGGPNIRRWAYTGQSVYKDLIDNAEEFINSNRGTFSSGGDDFRVSSFYMRNSGYFPNWNTDLKAHLLSYIEGVQREQLMQAEHLVADIDDWTITDVFGSEQVVGGSLSHNSAAMLGAVGSDQRSAAQVAVEGVGTASLNYTADPNWSTSKNGRFTRFKRGEEVQLPDLDPEGEAGELDKSEQAKEQEDT